MKNKLQERCQEALRDLVSDMMLTESNEDFLETYKSILSVVHTILVDGGEDDLDKILKVCFNEYYSCPPPYLIFNN